MRNISKLRTKLRKKQLLFYLFIVTGFILMASFSIRLIPSGIFLNKQQEQKTVTISRTLKTENALNKTFDSSNFPTPSLLSANDPTGKVADVRIIILSPTPGLNANNNQSLPSSSSNSQQIGETASVQNKTPTPVSSLIPSPGASPTAVPTVIAFPVSVEIKTPDFSFSFSIELQDGMNVCDVLQKAKDEGKINSLTFDDSYLTTFKSRLVSEINGYKNNWTFTLNGNSPLGCSLANPKPNDIIIWKTL